MTPTDDRPIRYTSSCCSASMRAEGDNSVLGGTMYYVCNKCNKACDPKEWKEEIMTQPTDDRPQPKRKAIYSIQFYRDESGVLCMLETGQGGSINDYFSMGKFGHDLAKSELLDGDEKRALKSLCESYLYRLNKLTNDTTN